MLWGALALGIFAVSVLLGFLVPVSVTSNVQARAEPSGGWAVAWGLGIGPLALTAIAAAGVTPFVTCHLFGKQLARVSLSRRAREPGASETKAAAQRAKPSRLARRAKHFIRSLDPVDTVLAWWEKERVFEVTRLAIEVEYSFRDVALTGQTLAALYVLSGVLPERYVIQQTPGWSSEDRVALVADGRFRLWPGRLVVDVLGFVLKESAKARRKAAAAGE